MKKFINILIFLFIFALYLITFMMIYDNFRERKLNNQEKRRNTRKSNVYS